MFRHDSSTHEATRLARLAAMQRARGEHESADAAEARALALVGYQAPPIRKYWPSVAPSRIPGGKAAASIILGLVLVAGLASEAHASCRPTSWVELEEQALGAGSTPEAARSEAASYCEAASMPGTYEWASERAAGCILWGLAASQSWVERDTSGAFVAVCADGNGTAWLRVAP